MPEETVHATGALGQRLRAAREARSWTCEEAASRLRLPAQVVRTLESGNYTSVPYRIYLRGYLSSYTRLLDLPVILVDNVLREFGETPKLTTTGTVSRSRYLFDRYSVSALYLILTGVIIVPAVLLAMRTTFEPNLAQFTPLDTPLNAPASTTTTALATPSKPAEMSAGVKPDAPSSAVVAAAAAEPAPAKGEAPLIASMTPFSRLTPAQAAEQAPVTNTAAGEHSVRLSLREASWVEIIGLDGQRLEYGILPAGSVRTYTSDKPLEVRLGNSNGASVEVDGQAQDIAPYRRSNVAHFKLLTHGQPISKID